nr:YcgN family cysteine cluster protein [Formicincola oecophyllae]
MAQGGEDPHKEAPFWRTTPLDEMTRTQWESLCDGCGRCCLEKLRDMETDEIIWTNVGCRLLDSCSGHCTRYKVRQRFVPDCIQLTPALLPTLDWLPPTCAYKLLRDGFDLPTWHPLRSGTAETVRQVGVGVDGRAISEKQAGALEDHETAWPGKWPARAERPQQLKRHVKPAPTKRTP